MNNSEFLELIEKHPNLTVEGFGVSMSNELRKSSYEKRPSRSEESVFAESRQQLKDLYKEFLLCSEYLETHPDWKEGINSHHLKDLVQDWAHTEHLWRTYIPQGAMILAAHYAGLTVHKCGSRVDGRVWREEPTA